MLENIKSSYFNKIIFSFIEDSRKLKIIKYNKRLQNEIDISLINYKLFSGRYIVFETKEKIKGKEYFGYDDLLIFEGEYLNGKRNGKGKEYNYNSSKLEYEGEYLNGKRNGKGKEFYYNGKLRFEGEYLNGKRNGIGKEYSFEQKLRFDGEFIKGNKYNGKGYDDKTSEIKYELKNGKGFITEYDLNGCLIFEGEYLNGRRNGKGKEFYFADKLKFEGEYLNGERNGKGKEYDFEGNLIFEGEYLNGKRWNGKDVHNINYNNKYEIKNGKGFMTDYTKLGNLFFEGEYLNGEKNGKGKEFYHRGELLFEGWKKKRKRKRI